MSLDLGGNDGQGIRLNAEGTGARDGLGNSDLEWG